MDMSSAPAVLYLRKSNDPRNLASIEDQERLGRAAIAEAGWTLAAGAVIDDKGRSASRFATKGRPGWDELLGILDAGQARVVVVWESSRGDRKLTEWSAFLDKCRDNDIRIHVISHGRTYHLRNARDWRTLAEDGVDNAYESEMISMRVRRGNAGAALRGDPYGPVPYGYKAVYSEATGKREGWVIVPGHAEIVRHIVVSIGADMPVLALERDLASRGVASPLGREWVQSTIRKMARNPVYAALRKMPDGTFLEGNWPPIVTRQQWAEACKVLDGRRPMARPGKQKHLLSGLARCAECASPFVVYTRHGRMYYRCKKSCFSIHYEWLDEKVSGVIVARLSRPDAREIFRRDDSRSQAIENDLATLRARRSGFRKQAAAGKIEADALAEIEAELTPQIERLQRELDTLDVPPALQHILSVEDVAAEWVKLTVQGKRAIIAALTEVVVSRPRRQWRSMVLPEDYREILEFTWQPPDKRRSH